MKKMICLAACLALAAMLFDVFPAIEHAAGFSSPRIEVAQSAPCPNGVCPR